MTDLDDTTAPTRGSGAARAVVVAVLTVLAFAGAATGGVLIARSQNAKYRSTSLLAIDQPLVIASTRDAGPVEKLSRLRLQYAGLLRTDALAVPIANQVGLTPVTVSQRITATAVPDSLLIAVSAIGSTPDAAKRLAAAAAQELVNYAQRSQDQYSIPAAQQVVLGIATPARDGGAITRSTRTVVTVAGFLGLAAAGLVLALASLVRRRSR